MKEQKNMKPPVINVRMEKGGIIRDFRIKRGFYPSEMQRLKAEGWKKI